MIEIIRFITQPEVMKALTPVLIVGIITCIYVLKELDKWKESE